MLGMALAFGMFLNGCMSLEAQRAAVIDPASAYNHYTLVLEYLDESVPYDQQSRLYVVSVDIVGFDGNMTPLKALAQAPSVLFFPAEKHSINAMPFETKYPGARVSYDFQPGEAYAIMEGETKLGGIFADTVGVVIKSVSELTSAETTKADWDKLKPNNKGQRSMPQYFFSFSNYEEYHQFINDGWQAKITNTNQQLSELKGGGK
jgi:hypothetical protein